MPWIYRNEMLPMYFLLVMLNCCCCTWKAFARAWAPSFSKRLRPATNTLSFSGVPLAEDCLWHSIRASARIYKTHTHTHATVIGTSWIRLVESFKPKMVFGGLCWHRMRRALTFPPPMPMPQLLSLNSLSVWQEGLFSSCSIPFTPSGPKALSLKSSSISRAPALIMAQLKCF